MIFDQLNQEQQNAVLAMQDFVNNKESLEFLLEGPAGTGKTFCMKAFIEKVKKRTVFTAPTNKAVRVLKDALTSEDYTPKCKTIYSVLGLTLQPNGEVKELTAPDPDDIDLSEYSIIVVDEASMVNTILSTHIHAAQGNYPHLKWIFVGDPYQLPPVGEDVSPVWQIKAGAKLSKIMRHDNSILLLAGQCRELISSPMRALKLERMPDVHPLSTADFQIHVRENAAMFLAGRAKVISWRNVKVDEYNRLVRRQLFAEPDLHPWQPGDRITTQEPYKDLGDKDRQPAATDDEGVVEKAEIAPHPLYPEFNCWRILFRKDDNQLVTLWTLHLAERSKWEAKKSELAASARTNKRLWHKFWEFVDAFAKVRHAYAITSHKSQGSTYERVYVHWRDIMLNDNRVEAYKCLYVAVTRAKKEVYLG